MGLLRSNEDIIETWYFETKEEARADNLKNAIGYVKVVDGVNKEEWGKTDAKWSYLKSKTTIGTQSDMPAASV